MIRIQVDILKHGFKQDKIPIGEIEIMNERHIKNDLCGYAINVFDNTNITYRAFYVEHKRSDGIWILIEKVIKKITQTNG